MRGSQGVLVNSASKGASTADIQTVALPSVRLSSLEAVFTSAPDYEEQFSYKRFPYRWLRLSRKPSRKRDLLGAIGGRVAGIASMPVSPSVQRSSLSPLHSPLATPRRGGGFLFDHREGLRRKAKPVRLPHLSRIYLN